MKKRTLNDLIMSAHQRGSRSIDELIDASSFGEAEVKAMADSVPQEVADSIVARADALASDEEDPFITRLRGVLHPEIDDLLLRRFVEFAVGLDHGFGVPSSFSLLLDFVQAIRGNPTRDELPYLESIEEIQRQAATQSLLTREYPYDDTPKCWMQIRGEALYRLARLRVELQRQFGGI